MNTETVGILGLFGLLFVIGIALSLALALARKPFKRSIEKIIPPSRYSGQFSEGMRITVEPDGHAPEEASYSVNRGAGNSLEATENEDAVRSPLGTVQRRRYEQEWLQIRRLFHEAPDEAVRAADRLFKDIVKETGTAQVSLRTMHQTEGDLRDAVGTMKDAVNLAQNARSAARGIALATQYQNASSEDLTQAMDYYRELFDKLLASDAIG